MKWLMMACVLGLPALAHAEDGNEVVLRCTDEGTTYDKEKCRKANSGKEFTFEGQVFDVKSAKKLDVKLDSGNYAWVEFKTKVGDTVSKGQYITFTGKVVRFGTGILSQHEVVKAVLKDR
jgi:hypothetical protein